MRTEEERAFAAFVAARWHALLRTAALLAGDQVRGEDLLQAALAKLWFAWARVDGDPEAYLRRILVTTQVSWWRRRSSGERLLREAPERPGPDATTQVLDRQLVEAALSTLTARQRAVVVLRYAEDLPEAQVAELLGCSVGTVKTLASRALAKLRAAAVLQVEGESRVLGGAP